MPFPRPSRSDDHLSNYWNALVRNAPAEELARLAQKVEPADLAAIEHAYAAHTRYEPDPNFARSLEETLMDSAMSPVTGTIPHPRVAPPSRNGSTGPGPAYHPGTTPQRHRGGWAISPAVTVGLAIVIALTALAGYWLTNTPQDSPRLLMAPDVTTDDTLGDHPAVGAWASSNGVPCWCLNVFTADGLAFGMDPQPAESSGGLGSSEVAMGIWQPTGDRTAVGIVRFPADEGGYVERAVSWEVSEDGTTMSGTGTQRLIGPDGKVTTFPGTARMEAVRVTMPEDLLGATPES